MYQVLTDGLKILSGVFFLAEGGKSGLIVLDGGPASLVPQRPNVPIDRH